MNSNNKYDDFNEIFRQKLENHEVPVDPSDWDMINKRLSQNTSFRKKLIRVWSGVAAIMVIILVLSLFYIKDRSTQYTQSPVFSEEIEYLPIQDIAKPDAMTSIQDGDKGKPQIDHPLRKNMLVSVQTSNPVIRESPVETDKKETKDSLSSGEILVVENKKEKKSNNETDLKKDLPDKKNQSTFGVNTDNPVHPKKKQKESWLLAANFGTGSGLGNNDSYDAIYQNEYASPSTGYDGNKSDFLSNNGLIPENTKATYAPPLSFGLTVRKYMNKHWGLETGLVYTYLSSTYQWTSFWRPSEATQQLHYLGIPLNGVVNIWNSNPRWNIYFSGGVMLEKGLRMKTVVNQYLENYTYTTTQKRKIDGLQWSLNSSLGVSYSLYRGMKFYVEPRFSYYFDNDQPESIRTDWPVSVGIGAGLQYSF